MKEERILMSRLCMIWDLEAELLRLRTSCAGTFDACLDICKVSFAQEHKLAQQASIEAYLPSH